MNKINKMLGILLLTMGVNSIVIAQNVYFINKTKVIVYMTNRTLLEQGASLELRPGDREVQHVALPTKDNAVYNLGIATAKGAYGTNFGKYYLLKPNDTIILIKENELLHLKHASSNQRSKELEMGEEVMANVAVKPFFSLDMRKIIAYNNKKQSFIHRDKVLDSISMPIIRYIDKYTRERHIDSEISKQYRYNYIGMLYYSKLFIIDSRDIQYKKAFVNYYKDSVIAWTKLFNCDNCSNIPLYNSAAKMTFDLAYENLSDQNHLNAIATNSSGKTRDFLLSAYINDKIADNVTGLSDLFIQYKALCKDPLYRKSVNDNYELAISAKPSEKGSTTLLSDTRSKMDFDSLIKSNKGKIIYIDFWASWCKPCLAELPYSIALNKKLQDNKTIKMIYISIDRDFNNWLKMEKLSQINGLNSYILMNSGKDNLTKLLDISAIPRYVIIGKNGKFINTNANRPSDEKLYLALTELSQKND